MTNTNTNLIKTTTGSVLGVTLLPHTSGFIVGDVFKFVLVGTLIAVCASYIVLTVYKAYKSKQS